MSAGNILQAGFVVAEDQYEATLEYWLSQGVGPFFEMPHVELPEQQYRGKPTSVDMSVAIAYSGDTQVEIIVQHNDAPSLYLDFVGRHGGGLHHLAYLSEHFDEQVAAAAERGQPVVQLWKNALGSRFAYYEPLPGVGSCVELIEADPVITRVFAMMEKAARDWDGSAPRRKLG